MDLKLGNLKQKLPNQSTTADYYTVEWYSPHRTERIWMAWSE